MKMLIFMCCMHMLEVTASSSSKLGPSLVQVFNAVGGRCVLLCQDALMAEYAPILPSPIMSGHRVRGDTRSRLSRAVSLTLYPFHLLEDLGFLNLTQASVDSRGLLFLAMWLGGHRLVYISPLGL